MNSINKLHGLFTKHLRTIYDGEKQMTDTLTLLCKQEWNPGLHTFFEEKLREKTVLVKTFQKMFSLMHIAADGESDDVIFSCLHEADQAAGIQMAICITGRALNIYQVNGIKAAISCADELGYDEISGILHDCLKLVKFTQSEHNLVLSQARKMGIEQSSMEAA